MTRLVVALAGLAWCGGEATFAASPNIVILYADDLGYGDPRCYNPDRGRIPTPRIDRLAREGMRFTDAHSSSGVCSPSRYALLTGRYHWRSRLQSGIVETWAPPLIAPDRLTVAGLASRNGYRTACIGKWHLGWDWPIEKEDKRAVSSFNAEVSATQRAAWHRIFSQPIGGGPTSRGFAIYFGTDVPNWPPYCFIDGDRTVGIPQSLLPLSDLKDHRASLQGPALDDWRLEHVLPTLRDQAVTFIRESARLDVPFLLYIPLTAPHTPLAVNAPWKGKSGLDHPCADLVMETDAVVGDVLDALDTCGESPDTVVILTSDNGFEPGVGVKQLESRGHFPSGPLRGYKADAWEGGHRIPFIVRYPGVVQPGSVCPQLVHQADIMATVAEIIGATLPPDAGEDSVSLMPLLKDPAEPVRRYAVSCSAKGIPAIRDGQWKLILGPGSGWERAAGQEQHLYDLATDLGERNDLAATHPDRVAAMRAIYRKIVADGRSTPGPRQQNDVEVEADAGHQPSPR